jgi:transposase-like protein
MNMHKNARLTPRGRERIVRQAESGQTLEAVAEAVGVCPRTARKWVDRYRREGLAGLQDRSSRPHRLRRPTPQAVVEEIEWLRRQGTSHHRTTAWRGQPSPRIGWEFIHVCIDDASRVAFVQLMANQRRESAVAFLEAAVAYFHQAIVCTWGPATSWRARAMSAAQHTQQPDRLVVGAVLERF